MANNQLFVRLLRHDGNLNAHVDNVDIARCTPYTRKPIGFWFSVNYDFFKWEFAEGFYVNNSMHWHELFLKDNVCTYDINDTDPNKILVVGPNDVALYTYHYFKRIQGSPCLDYSRLNKDFAGVIFIAYNRSLAFNSNLDFDSARDFMWYSEIDGSSGCIWRNSVVHSINPAENAFDLLADDPTVEPLF